MPFTVSWTIGTTVYTESFPNMSNVKVRNLLQRSAIFQGIPVAGKTEEQIAKALMAKDLDRHKLQSEHVQRSQLENANEASISAILAADNTLS